MYGLCIGNDDEVNKGKPHYFILESPRGKPTVDGICKYCKFKREHRITPIDGMESGRKAMKLKREKQSESIRRL